MNASSCIIQPLIQRCSCIIIIVAIPNLSSNNKIHSHLSQTGKKRQSTVSVARSPVITDTSASLIKCFPITTSTLSVPSSPCLKALSDNHNKYLLHNKMKHLETINVRTSENPRYFPYLKCNPPNLITSSLIEHFSDAGSSNCPMLPPPHLVSA